MKTTSLFSLLLLSGITLTSCKQGEKTVVADDNSVVPVDTVAKAPANANTETDATFFTDAANINLEEIALGKLTQTRSANKEVKDYAKMMVDGHTKCLAELKALAAKKGATLPQDVSEEDKAAAQELTAANGKSFDKMYIDKMVNGHTGAIAKFDSERNNTKDADIKAWVVKTLPDLHMHLDHAVTVQQKIQ